jgi:hypothetical protein
MIESMKRTSYLYVVCKCCGGHVPLQEKHPDFRFPRFPIDFMAECGVCGIESKYHVMELDSEVSERIPNFEGHPNFPRVALATMYSQQG